MMKLPCNMKNMNLWMT